MTNVAEIYSKYYTNLIGFSYRITKSHALAEDAVSELFKRLTRVISTRGVTFNSEELLSGWLHKSLRRCCYTLMKKESRYLDLDETSTSLIPDETNALEESSKNQEAKELLTLLNEEIQQLPPKQKRAILLRYFSGKIMSYDDIAKKTKSNDNAVGFLLNKATNKLKSRLVAKWQTQQT
jgi:RNA polymerase sigma factor (sigma-70 family)